MVKQGYKQTEIGVIPEDWDVKNLIDLSDGGMQNGVFYEVSRKGSGVFFLNVGNLYETAPITTRTLEKFDATTNEIERFKVKHGDLFFTRSSIVPSGIAYCNWYKGENDETTVFDSHVVRFKTDTEQVVPMYLYLQCISYSSRKYFISNAKVATMTTIDQNQIGRCQIPVPTYDEQKRIAEAFSDVDSMISSLEKLIAKKKDVKQGAMQELLTGKKRLPGFTGEWYETTIGEHCYVFDGTHQTPKYTIAGIPFYSVENVTANDFVNTRFITAEEHEQLSSKCKIKKGDILMTRIGSIGDCKYIDWDVNASFYVSLALIKCKETINARFLSFYSTSSYFKKEIEIRSLLTAIPQKINLGPISEIRLNIPSDIKEQEAIASILSNMDNEIKSLEQKLAKTRQIKQGMMQQLLTGKIRLV